MNNAQETGGPVERAPQRKTQQRRSLSGSGLNASGDAELKAETTVSRPQPTPEESDSTRNTNASQTSPRKWSAPAGAPTLKRQPSDNSDCSYTNTKSESLNTTESHNVPLASAEYREVSQNSRPLEPPVTKATLSELDVTKIVHNPKLRHDINFDPELHFRPNLEGDKGRRKARKTQLFWRAMETELSFFATRGPEAFIEKYGCGNDWTLPQLLIAVKDIIQTLVPQRDRQLVEEGLNVELLMQQFYRGILDLEKLARWLSGILKSHCAPMRDEWVDGMYKQLSGGSKTNNLGELVTGMISLLSVLEAMKLDVANHQIRCLRLALIEDTIKFEKRFFSKKIRSRKMSIDGARSWYDSARERNQYSATQAFQFGDMGIFFEGLVRLILPSATRPLPSTFSFDDERMMKLRSDLLDAINLEICMRLFDDLEHESQSSSSVAFAEQFSAGDARHSCASVSDFDFNTPPTGSRPSSLVLSATGSESSSARSSVVLPAYIAMDSAEQNAKSKELYKSLLALLQSQPTSSRPAERWNELAPSMALQIFRFSSAPQDALERFESKLVDILKQVHAPYYQTVEREFFLRLLQDLGPKVREFRHLSYGSLFSVVTASRASAGARNTNVGRNKGLAILQRDYHEEGSLEDIVTHMAHMGIIHWRVWQDLAYVRDTDYEMSG